MCFGTFSYRRGSHCRVFLANCSSAISPGQPLRASAHALRARIQALAWPQRRPVLCPSQRRTKHADDRADLSFSLGAGAHCGAGLRSQRSECSERGSTDCSPRGCDEAEVPASSLGKPCPGRFGKRWPRQRRAVVAALPHEAAARSGRSRRASSSPPTHLASPVSRRTVAPHPDLTLHPPAAPIAAGYRR